MQTTERPIITVEAIVDVPIDKAWQSWTDPEHIKRWNAASADWHTTSATNDLRTGGIFTSRMEAKDGSMGFDFAGVYDVVNEKEYIEYTLADGRKVVITFTAMDHQTRVVESFEAEAENTLEMQKAGWQAIMNNYKEYTEKL